MPKRGAPPPLEPLVRLRQLPPEASITLSWTVDDILARAPHLTREQASEFLGGGARDVVATYLEQEGWEEVVVELCLAIKEGRLPKGKVRMTNAEMSQVHFDNIDFDERQMVEVDDAEIGRGSGVAPIRAPQYEGVSL